MATRKRISTVLGIEVEDGVHPDLAGKPLAIGSVLWRSVNIGTWQMYAITSETKGLWIVSGGHRVNKKTLMEADGRGRGEPRQWFTTPQKLDEDFRTTHRYLISEKVRWETDTGKLREIAKIVGYGHT